MKVENHTNKSMSAWYKARSFTLFHDGTVEYAHSEIYLTKQGEMLNIKNEVTKNKKEAQRVPVITKLKLDGVNWPQTVTAQDILLEMRNAYKEMTVGIS